MPLYSISNSYNSRFPLRSLATAQPHSLAVLLQLRNELIALADNVLILLVLVVGAVRLDDALARDTVNGARDAAGGNEFRKVAINSRQ